MVICLDTETTGLNSGEDEILSISIVNVYTGAVLLDTLVQPVHHDEWPDAERINHIRPEDVKCSPRIQELKPKIQSILNNAAYLIGYNIKFDLSFLRAAGIHYSGMLIDVADKFRGIRRWNYYCRLTECASWYNYGWPEGGSHTSLGDVRATIFVYKAIKQEWKELEPFLRLNKAFLHLREVTRYNPSCPMNTLQSIRRYVLSSKEVQMEGRNARAGVKAYIERYHQDWIPSNGIDALVDLILDESFSRSF